jgi:hypothetical protein
MMLVLKFAVELICLQLDAIRALQREFGVVIDTSDVTRKGITIEGTTKDVANAQEKITSILRGVEHQVRDREDGQIMAHQVSL